MFVERCASCHNEDKSESDLVLTTYAGVMRGGESGRVVVAGNTELPSSILSSLERLSGLEPNGETGGQPLLLPQADAIAHPSSE